MNESDMIEDDGLAGYVDKLNEITGQFRMPDWEQCEDAEWQQMLMQDEAYIEWREMQEAKESERDDQ